MTPQQAYAFVESQARHIERNVYRKRYASIQYKDLVPVDTSAHDWARGITYYSSDAVGSADFLAGRANDFPLVNFNMSKDDSRIEMLGLGYDWSLEEISFARMTGNLQVISEKAMAVRRMYEEKVDDIVKNGYSPAGWHSLMKPALVRRVAAALGKSGTGDVAKRKWTSKTAEEIISDVNSLLMGIYYGDPGTAADKGTSTVEIADTILMSPKLIVTLNEKVLANTDKTVIQFIEENNVYTRITGKKLKWRVYRGLETAGRTTGTVASASDAGYYADKNPGSSGDAGRIIAYRRDPEVLKLHLPMPLRFLNTWQASPMRWIRGAIFRLGGLEVRLPGAMRVMDGIE